MTGKIIFKTKGNVGTIILNAPEKLNAFDIEMIKNLDRILDTIFSSNLKVIIIKGNGTSFCSGGDIEWEEKLTELGDTSTKKEMGYIQQVFSKIEKLPQIFIALIHGYAIGGGNELAMACDIRIALPSAIFAHPETALSTVAPLGGTKRLPRLIGLGKAKYLLFTGNKIDSQTALLWGLVDFVVSEKEIDHFLDTLVSQIESKDKNSLALTKESVNSNYLSDLTDEFELNAYVKCSRTEENKQSLRKFLEKRKK